MAESRAISFKDRLQNAAARLILGGALLIPYPARVRTVGWIFAHLVAPFVGWRTRIRDNLNLVLPDLPEAEVRKIERNVPNNVGRTLIEIYSGDEFIKRVANAPLIGPGVEALQAAKQSDAPLILITAHMGNYDAVRGTLTRQGLPMAALYKPMTNALFNEHYVRAISVIAEPVFPTDGSGIPALVRHLRSGGTIGIVGDVASRRAPILSFFKRDAHTPLSAAEWALKFDAPLIPVYGIRQPDGLSFQLYVDNPLTRGAAEEMMQQYNDSVEAVAREHLDQWFWVHRRWKISGR